MPKLFNQFTVKAVITSINPMKFTKTNIAYMGGFLACYDEKDGKRMNSLNLQWVAFENAAKQLNELEIKKGDVVLLHGSLIDNTFKDLKTTQFKVASAVYDEEDNRKNEYETEDTQDYALQNPYQKPQQKPIVPDNDDDFPF